MKYNNEKLLEWVSDYPSFSEAAKAINVSQSSISCWIRHKRKPSLQKCLKIVNVSNGKYTLDQLRPDLFDD